jgi:D-glycero-alpha-D-manno-heptose-7-phosphate kinase
MVITKTPFRISLFGGGTDHPAWFRENGGEVISFAINKYCYISARILPPFFEHTFRIAYSKVETVSSIDQIMHPVVKAAIKKYSPNLNLEIHHDGDLPARSGVGSSSAFAVGLIHALQALQDIAITPNQLASEAISLEKEDLKENVGYQDQIACALGGFNYIKFSEESKWEVEKIDLEKEYQTNLMERLVLVYTGISRRSSDIQRNLLQDINLKSSAMSKTINLARECKKIIEKKGDLDQIGHMLAESWEIKREMNSIAITPELDRVWEKARAAGAIGGKVLGAGGGGFCIFWVKNEKRRSFLDSFNFGTYVPIDVSDAGSTCLLK